ncbi:kinase-like protein [Metschnikowia bicuspidata var. bicuspidata NRRL YB-4993]|uniref:Kinase-like protein n=1 Tax=Metschnikowia bicuspidata var. bicuspidata NRRL YB-4993 TaxID=869754 RepID=A0A1A0HJG2_9ASCO|nr:kinase-like protein [Metschnikowia bicuspidata var. bicuspidata NRRL YB-4993]OBA23978.1 kinase-like protein [Metschnikowia bicuspidata var. bicuspidata NRRL YB-4993]
MPLFEFDDEDLASDLGSIGFEADSPAPVQNETPDADVVCTTIPPSRRRSTIYRRVLVRSSAPNSGGIAIPADFDSAPEEESAAAPKKCLADFKPLKVLGQGAYGKVHLVQDRLDGKLYAQKQIRKPQVDVFEYKPSVAANHVRRTIAERQILSEITHHKSIVKLFYALQDEGKFYLLLEYIPGGELFHHLTVNNKLGNVFLEKDVAFYIAEMALGLKHLHLLGIVYRDLKPENCLLNSKGHLVLTDFGLSKNVGNDHDSACHSIIGTPEYMAPEILKGLAYGYAVDWWLLGCVMYDMLTSRPPFTGDNSKIICKRILKSDPLIPFYLSLDAKDLLSKLLRKDPKKRMAVDDRWAAFKKHRFFRKLNWGALEDQEAKPPLVPLITNPALAENFSDEFTGMRMSEYDGSNVQGPDVDHLFEGFSYTASESFLENYVPQ